MTVWGTATLASTGHCMSQDPRVTLATSPMTPAQVVVVAITVAITALDGFDVLSIAFASPGIAREWGIGGGKLGVVLGAELAGMMVGSITLGGLCDRVGRRYTMLGCLAVMALGMAMAATARGVYDLSAWRVFTGLGIGGILAASNAVASEFANARRRDLSVSLMAIGYPLGAIFGGKVAAVLLKGGNWRAVFEFGALATAIFLPIVYFWVPESVAWLCQKQPARALEAVNRSLKRLGRAAVDALPAPIRLAQRPPLAEIFRPELAATTILVTLTYFMHITTFYFIIKWVPKIVVDMGFAMSTAANVLVWTNVGGATGGAVLGLLTHRLGLKPLTVAMLLGSAVMVTVFGHGQATLAQLSLICATAGFCTNGAVVGIYAVLARAFPTELRATGTGFAIGAGRGGAALAPAVAGFLFQAGFGLQAVAVLMSVGSLLSAICMSMVRLKTRDSIADA